MEGIIEQSLNDVDEIGRNEIIAEHIWEFLISAELNNAAD